MQTEKVEEAEGLKKEIMTVARGLRIKREDSGKRKSKGVKKRNQEDVGS